MGAELDRSVRAMIAFIDDQRGAYGFEPICRVLPVAPPTYFAVSAVSNCETSWLGSVDIYRPTMIAAAKLMVARKLVTVLS